MDTKPKSLMAAIRYYSNPEVCNKLMISILWPHTNGQVSCIYCGTVGARFMESVQRFKCYSCRKQFSIKKGTVLEDSPLPLSTWLPAFWMIVNAKNGVSSCELAKSLDVTQKTAWFMLHRIRHVLNSGKLDILKGTVVRLR